MQENDDLLGLGALWDVERDNATLDEFRELARDQRSRGSFHDAILDFARRGAIDATVASSERQLHVHRIGLNWVDGRLCGGDDSTIVPLPSIRSVRSRGRCGCSAKPPRILEWVTLTAMFRRLERRASPVILTTLRGGIAGRIVGVWRDAIEVRNANGRALVPVSSLELVVVDGAGGS